MSKNRNTNYTNRPKAQTPVINNSEVEVNTENINIEEGEVTNEDIENPVMVDSNYNNYIVDEVSEERDKQSEIEEVEEICESESTPVIENIDTVSVVEEVESKDTIVTDIPSTPDESDTSVEEPEVVVKDMKEEESIKDDVKNENKVYPDDKFYLILSKFVSSDKFDIIKDRLSSTEYTAFIDKYGKILVGPFDTTADAIRAKKVIVGKGLKASIL